MSTGQNNRDFVKLPRLNRVGVVLASLWLLVLIAAVAATIYREIDGPSIRSTVAENRYLTGLNSTLNSDLDSARKDNLAANGIIDQLNSNLEDAHSDYASLKRRLDSYLSSAPLTQIGPDPGVALDILLFR